ncbi:Hint domain-containing protein [Roseicyclus mahoneyensis]|uniref:Hemolysin type calcium-binding protein n=1 Tax=Roseicyclus mahoneyensis TaxID=164332 RepID=A0A316GHQ2_9RHOB|nr:Hint domain-containing protein [Roseicyclus mahoneyensis]PWK59508.1 hemolysin type calcium-binding protein [Roseicyclus mahoneyensis]
MPNIDGTWQDDTLSGGSGDDSIRGFSGNDSLSGGDGDDTLIGASGSDTLVGGSGDDLLDGGSQNDLLVGGDGDDTLIGDSGADTLEGGAGNDLIDGGSQDDVISGGDGDDTILGQSGGDIISGGNGDDLLDGGSQNDTLFGGAGNDTLIGGSDNDWLDGGAGDDLIIAGGYGGGSDTIVFGPGMGNDTIEGFNPSTDFLHIGGVDRDDLIFTPTADPRIWVLTIDGVPDTSLTIDFTFYWDAGVNIAELDDRVLTDTDVTPPDDPYEDPICLTAGVLVQTARGPVPAAALREGDRVQTRDAGWQPVRAVLRRWFPATELAADPSLRPVRVAAGAFGNGLPLRDMRVSLQHCFLAADPAGRHPEAIIRARHIAVTLGQADLSDDAPAQGESYVHILLDAHHLILAEGVWTETIFAGPCVLAADAVLARMLGGRRLPAMEARVRPALTRRDLRGFAGYVLGGAHEAASPSRRAA